LYTNHTSVAKDQFVKQFWRMIVDSRTAIEMNETLEDLGMNELGEEDGSPIENRFFDQQGKDDCIKQFKRLFCYMNFPRCDNEDRSLLLCRSVCENLHIACGYTQDLFRCADPSLYYGAEPEEPEETTAQGNPVYWRAPYPGGPFRTNRFEGDDDTVTGTPIVVCTPSIAGGAEGGGPRRLLAALAIAGNVLVGARLLR
jgi:hypothetical protein